MAEAASAVMRVTATISAVLLTMAIFWAGAADAYVSLASVGDLAGGGGDRHRVAVKRAPGGI